MTSLAQFIEHIPKAELHLHLEGSLEPEQMFTFAQRNRVDIPFKSVAEIRSAYQFNNLQEFLDIYYAGMNVLQTEQDFYDLTHAYLKKCKTDHVQHVEVFFDPQAHTERAIPFSIPVAGIHRALKEGTTTMGISYKLIMCFLRHLDEQCALQTLEQAQPYMDLIDGVGLDSSEVGHPPAKFTRVFAAAKQEGLFCVAHAGEEGPPQYIWEAVDLLRVDRIDHGNRAVEDPALINMLAQRKLALTLCPLSNIKLCVVDDLRKHPLKSMMNAGLLTTVNSDDPAYFGGYINQNYQAIAQALDLCREDIVTLAKNSFKASFLCDAKKQDYLCAVDQYATDDCQA